MIGNSAQLKGLTSQLAEEEAALRVSRVAQRQANQKVSQTENRIRELKLSLEKLKTKGGSPIVSEHALLRYLERVKGVDLEALKTEILTKKTIEMIEFARNCTVKGDSYSLVVKDGVVITVTD
jgi:chromosome segregation ATPase